MTIDNSQYRIIFLVGGPLTERWLSYYRLDTLCQYFDVEYWDCSGILLNNYKISNPQNRSYVYTIDSFKTLNERLRANAKKGIIIPEIGFHKDNYKIFKRIAKYIKDCVIIDVWTFPLDRLYKSSTSANENKLTEAPVTFKKRIYQITILRWLAKLVKFGPTKKYISYLKGEWNLYSSKRYMYWEKECKDFFRIYTITYGKDAKYPINHPDYESYLTLKDLKTSYEGNYIVYIGQYFPYHADIVTTYPELKKKPFVAEQFYHALNHFFDKIEQETGCKVIIAEHPSGYHECNPFNGREIVYYRTSELIKNAQAVCLHYSNSVNFVALFNKPFAILDCAALRYTPRVYAHLQHHARQLKRNPINIEDDNIRIDDIFKPLDNHFRLEYLSLLKGGESENLTNDELMVSSIRSIINNIQKRNE